MPENEPNIEFDITKDGNYILHKIAYNFSVLTLIGPTEHEALGSLPYPVRLAFLKALKNAYPEAIELNVNTVELLQSIRAGDRYERIDSWSTSSVDLSRLIKAAVYSDTIPE